MKKTTLGRSLFLLICIVLSNLATSSQAEEAASYQARSGLSESRREDLERRRQVLVSEHLSTAISAESEESEQAINNLPRTHRFQPCTFWRYDFTVNGNICTSTDSNIEVTDARDVNQMMQTISKLQTTIIDLQNRVTALENTP